VHWLFFIGIIELLFVLVLSDIMTHSSFQKDQMSAQIIHHFKEI